MNIQNWLTEEENEELLFVMEVLRSGSTPGEWETSSKLPDGDEYKIFNETLSRLIILAHKRASDAMMWHDDKVIL